jgi:hypothetical protein
MSEHPVVVFNAMTEEIREEWRKQSEIKIAFAKVAKETADALKPRKRRGR